MKTNNSSVLIVAFLGLALAILVETVLHPGRDVRLSASKTGSVTIEPLSGVA